MSQAAPSYGHMISAPSVDVLNEIKKSGAVNLCWPIVLIDNQCLILYYYEKNNLNSINTHNARRPTSKLGLPSHFVDYSSSPRTVDPTNPVLISAIQPQYNNSYNWIQNNQQYSTVDIDYVYFKNRWVALETTTVWMPMTSQAEAERLVSKFKKRQSWQGQAGPHGILRQIEAAEDLDCEYWMVVLNTIGKVSVNIATNGNAYRFPLNKQNVNAILNGNPIAGGVFDSFQNIIVSI